MNNAFYLALVTYLYYFQKNQKLRMNGRKRSHAEFKEDLRPIKKDKTSGKSNGHVQTSDSKASIPPYSVPTSLPYPLTDATLPALPSVYSADNPNLAEAPFVHSSISDSRWRGTDRNLNYERLEFLGDAYLEVIATRLIFDHFPWIATGKMSSLRETLVCNKSLAGIARRYHFQDRLQMDAVVRNNLKPKSVEKMMADMVEAYIAAIILADPASGFSRAEAWLTDCWAAEGLLQQDAVAQDAGGRDAVNLRENMKDKLHSLIGHRTKLDYRDVVLNDPARPQVAGVRLFLTGYGYHEKEIGYAEGVGKKEAGMLAAKNAMDVNKTLVDECAEIKRKGVQERRERAMQSEQASQGR